MYTSDEGRLWLGETPLARTCEVIGASIVGIKFGEEGFPKISISCFLIVAKDKFRSIGGSEFQR